MPLLLDAHDPNAAPREVPPDDADMGVRAGAYDYVGGTRYDLVSPDGVVGDAAAENVTTLLRRGYRFAGSSSPAAKAEPPLLKRAVGAVQMVNPLTMPFVAARDIASAMKGEPTATGALLSGEFSKAADIAGQQTAQNIAGVAGGLVPGDEALARAALSAEAAREYEKLKRSGPGTLGELQGFAAPIVASGGMTAAAEAPAAATALRFTPGGMYMAAEQAGASLAGRLGLSGAAATAAGLATGGAAMGALGVANATGAAAFGQPATEAAITADDLGHPAETAARVLPGIAKEALANVVLGGALHVGGAAVGKAGSAVAKWLKPLEGDEAIAERVEQAMAHSPREETAGKIARELGPQTVEAERARYEFANAPERLRQQADIIEKSGNEIQNSVDAVMKADAPGDPDTHALEAKEAAAAALKRGQALVDEITGPNRADMFRREASIDNVMERQKVIESEMRSLEVDAAALAAKPGIYQSPESVRNVQAAFRDYSDALRKVWPEKYRPLLEGEVRVPDHAEFGKDYTPEARSDVIERAKAHNASLEGLRKEFNAEPVEFKRGIAREQYVKLNEAKQNVGRVLRGPYANAPAHAPLPRAIGEISDMYDGTLNGLLSDARVWGDVANKYAEGNKLVSNYIEPRDFIESKLGTEMPNQRYRVLDELKFKRLFRGEALEGNVNLGALDSFIKSFADLELFGKRVLGKTEGVHLDNISKMARSVADGVDTLEKLARENEVAAAIKEAIASGNEQAIPGILRANYGGAKGLAEHTTAIEKHASALATARGEAKRIGDLVRDVREVGTLGSSVANVMARLRFRRMSGGFGFGRAGEMVASALPGGGALHKVAQVAGEIGGAKAGMAHGMANEAATNVAADVMQMAHLEQYARSAKAKLDKGVDGFFERQKLKFWADYAPSVRKSKGVAEGLTRTERAAKAAGSWVDKIGAAAVKANKGAISALTTYALRDRFIGAATVVERAQASLDKTPQALAMALGSDLASSPQVAAELDAGMKNIIGFLSTKLPAQPPPALGQRARIDEGVSRDDADKFLRYFEAATDPTSVLDELAAGRVSRESVETLQALYPTIYKDLQDDFTARIEALKEPLPYKAQVLLGTLFDLPTTPTLDPAFVQRVQGAYMSDNQPSEGMGPGRGAPRPVASHQAQETATPAQKLAGA